MDTPTFDLIISKQLDWCMKKLTHKADEYAEDNDRLHNFRVTAALRDTDMRDAVSGMMAKHTVSVYDMCNALELDDLAQWDEKIGDSINYLLLLRAVVQEEYDTTVEKQDFGCCEAVGINVPETSKMDAVAASVSHYLDMKGHPHA